jgi:hypothetical protein
MSAHANWVLASGSATQDHLLTPSTLAEFFDSYVWRGRGRGGGDRPPTIVCFQTTPGLSQVTNMKEILKSQNIRRTKNAQVQLVLKNYLKKAMLNHVRILLQTLKEKKKIQMIKVTKHWKMNPYKRRLS